jgi:hypothetical protein
MEEKLVDLYHKTVEVRALQKNYFMTRDKAILKRSKQAESELDSMILWMGDIPTDSTYYTDIGTKFREEDSYGR